MIAGRGMFVEARDDAAYAEACGRVRVLEKRLLTASRLDDLLELRGVEPLLQALRRLGQLAGSAEDPPADWERGLERSLAESDRLLLAIDPRPLVTAVLAARADVANLRGLLRARDLGLPHPPPWAERGLRSREALQAMVRDGDFAGFPPALAAELNGLRDLPPLRERQCLNNFLEGAWFGALLAAVRESGSRFFLDWLGHRADLVNLRVRLRALAAPGAWPEPVPVLPGGHLGTALFAPRVRAADLAAALRPTVYGPVLERAREGGALSLARLEREADDFLTRLLRPARFIALGPEPLWACHIARETDAKNVRAIVLGALAGLAPGRRRTLLREPYA